MHTFKADHMDYNVQAMNPDDFCGKYAGAYCYGESYPAPIRGKTVAFEIDLTVQKGLVSGNCLDDEATPHFNEPASLEGAVHGLSISFIKRYPHYWQQEESGPRFLPKMPSQEVCYSGQYVNGQFEGEWEINTQLTDAAGQSIIYKGVGSWYMRKI